MWSGGRTHELGAMPAAYGTATGILTGSTTDRFVINAELAGTLPGSNDAQRAVIYDRGAFREIGSPDNIPDFRSTATAMNAEGSIVVGFSTDESGDPRDAASWMLDDSGLRALSFDGLTGVRIGSVTDDGRLVTGRGYDASGDPVSFLARPDGRVWLMSDLLAGLGLPPGWGVRNALISADGTTIGGEFYHNTSDLRPSFFLYTVPVPGVLAPIALGGLLAARRHR